jgi:hypothetical protein
MNSSTRWVLGGGVAMFAMGLGACGAMQALRPPGSSPEAQAKLFDRYSAEDGYEALTKKDDFGPRGVDRFLDRQREAALGGSPIGKAKFCGYFNKGTGHQTSVMPTLKSDLLKDPNRHYAWLDDRYEYFSVVGGDATAFDQAAKHGTVCVWIDSAQHLKKKMSSGPGEDLVSLYEVAKWDYSRPEDDPTPGAATSAAAPSSNAVPDADAGAEPPAPADSAAAAAPQ